MSGKSLTTTKNPKDGDEQSSSLSWHKWCRLCAKSELNDEYESSIFAKNEAGANEADLATSVGKYFWVNIKAEDEISQCLCRECRKLVEELVTFTERVNKVQTLFVLLQTMKPKTIKEAVKFRTQFGLSEEGWQHIIKPEAPKIQETPKPLLIDQQIQTDLLYTNVIKELDTQTSICKAKKDLIDILQRPDKNEDYESQTETEQDTNIYEFTMQEDNEVDFVENEDFVVPSGSSHTEVIKSSQEDTEPANELEDEELQDSDLFKELKFKHEDDEEEEEEDDGQQQQPKRFKIISAEEEVEVEYQDSQQTIEHTEEEENEEDFVEDMGDSLEVLDEERTQNYVNTSDSKNNTQPDIFELLKGKRGRPYGSKKLDSNNTSYRYECKECKRRYKNPTIFRKHMITLHDVIAELPNSHLPSNKCSVCSKEFLTRSSLRLHMRNHLPDEEKYNVPCPYCERKFSQVGAMKQHVKGIHHQMKPFICDQCGKECKTMAALTEHQLVHTDECPFECEVCHKRFKNKPRLKSHMDTHTKSLYKCPDCDLELNTRRTLLQHRLVHSDVKRFKCEFCDAAFKRSKALKNHLILHSGLRPYKCNFCNRSFSNGSNCRAHKKRAHRKQLEEEEANGKVAERVPIPKLEELKTVKGVLVQPRKVRKSGGLSDRVIQLLQTAEERKLQNSQEYENDDGATAAAAVENYESYTDFHYEIDKSEVDETESLVDNPSEECEETVIYEIIDEI
ncbi:Zinc finger protein weckle [Lucilia cuprina]|uniref:Zinc finger protein weckle n=1 Tax=Lucilia cuprina TaxID=7375 RepID=A0A0L0C4F6_LUCCU|nr:Zinc finger protein weckle [Lucilia cuprina]KNC27116.1 Zinc finger protein weckle [Lucilia cuprina]